jgi:hypothetical protein
MIPVTMSHIERSITPVVPSLLETAINLTESMRGLVEAQNYGLKTIYIAAGGKGTQDGEKTIQFAEEAKRNLRGNIEILSVRRGKGKGVIDAANHLSTIGVNDIFLHDGDLRGVQSEQIIHTLNSVDGPNTRVRAVIGGTKEKWHQVITQRMLGRAYTGQRTTTVNDILFINKVMEGEVGYSLEMLLNVLDWLRRRVVREEIWHNTCQVDKAEKTGNIFTAGINTGLMHGQIAKDVFLFLSRIHKFQF